MALPPPVRHLPLVPADATVDPARLAEGPREECGVFGVYAPGEDVAKLTYYGLYALQHRGQESAGMAVSDGRHITVAKDMGLVHQVFNESNLVALEGHLAIGHVRYSTTGSSSWANAQPQYRETPRGGQLALAHNGNLCNTADVARMLGSNGPPVGQPDPHRSPTAVNDSGLMASLLAASEDVSLEEAIVRTMPRLEGAYSLVIMDEQAIHAVRDPWGVRPLVLGRLPGGYVIASESAALDIVGAHELREVEPGEVVTIDRDGLRSRRFADAQQRFCLFEWVYLARPDHRQGGTSVYAVRREMGRRLASEAPVDADLVIPVPDSGTAAAAGYAEASGLPYAEGLVKNRYVGRTFIQPSQSLRQLGIRLKLNPLRSVIVGKRLVVVDDSIVRGNTSRELVRMLREAGALEVHLRITSPPITHPCYYGIDMATPAELIGAGLAVEQIRDFVGADSLHYLSLDGLIGSTPNSRPTLCTACFTGEYPIPVPCEQVGMGQVALDLEALAPSPR
ncbi:MAG TPA: amidophosphoribosyltransferase [Nitriliruptorales bacterium]|nr:amidophosphoribosyltransferase [Nitriliruptorales bacterium]